MTGIYVRVYDYIYCRRVAHISEGLYPILYSALYIYSDRFEHVKHSMCAMTWSISGNSFAANSLLVTYAYIFGDHCIHIYCRVLLMYEKGAALCAVTATRSFECDQ